MPPVNDPLTDAQIHRAIRALDAGDRPHRTTLRTALLMALAWHAAQAEIAALRAGLQGLRRGHATSECSVLWDDTYPPTKRGCTCGAAEHNAKIAALLRG